MTRTFLCTLNLPDTADVSAVAMDIQDSLVDEGLSVVSVAPWKASGLDMTPFEQEAPSPMQLPEIPQL